MMKRTILLLLMVVSGALMLGCKDFDCCGPGVISTNPSALTIGGFIGASQDLVVNCPMAWTITDLPDWLIAEPDRGDFGGPVSLKATQENPPGADPRSAVITFMAANGDRVRMTITQSAQEVYTVTYSLTGVTRSNPAAAALQGEAYSTVFTAGTGYQLPASITVTMGGVLLTEGVEYDYDNATGEFEISNVTGNLVITIVGVETITVTAVIMTVTLYGSLDTPATVTSTSDISQAELDALITLHANRVITGWYTTDNPNGTKAVFPVTATTTLYVRLNGDGIFNTAPVEIVNAAELEALGTRVNATSGTEPAGLYYKLIADIDLGGAEWTPIGDNTIERPFRGHFDGDGFKVSGLYINRTTDDTGLFGWIQNSSIQNLGVEIAAGGVTGNNFTGGVAGYMRNSTISNCYVTGNVSGRDYVGGVAGFIGTNLSMSSSISNSYATGNISGNWYVGGVAGGVGMGTSGSGTAAL
ncbi:MAG: BACON domain-containing protein, partial [Bacteroidales bacterium]|nr:BACON domain-containing protein [Bacteroidales bacterium]